ncbi:hypothetical protein QL285_054555 [Trifolium repens]|nr:hypothetical protein QL285_054555 [Trifolium repens]
MVQLPCWLSRKFISHRDNRIPCINANQCPHAIITHLASMSTDAHVSLEQLQNYSETIFRPLLGSNNSSLVTSPSKPYFTSPTKLMSLTNINRSLTTQLHENHH